MLYYFFKLTKFILKQSFIKTTINQKKVIKNEHRLMEGVRGNKGFD